MKQFVPMLARYAGIDDQALLENDVRLHLLLEDLVNDDRIAEHLLFKGGTSLIKCHLHYPRFSTDIDFTWDHPDAWHEMGTNELRRTLRPIQRDLLDIIEEHADAHGLSFDPESPEDVQYGQSNKLMTIILHYETLGGIPRILKLQFNFLEHLLYEPQHAQAHSLLADDIPDELAVLDSQFPDRYATPVAVRTYDPRELLAEKGRAVLTRQATKVRDVLDLFLIETELGHPVADHEGDILEKTSAAVDRAQRYEEQLDLVDERFQALIEDDVEPLLLEPIDEAAFEEHRRHVVDVLDRVADKLA